MSDTKPLILTDSVAGAIYAERLRQIEGEGFSPERDLTENYQGQLALAAAAYLVSGTPAERLKAVFSAHPGSDPVFVPEAWPKDWDASWFKPGDRERNLIKAGALIIAELERLDRINGIGKAILSVWDQILPHVDDAGGGQ